MRPWNFSPETWKSDWKPHSRSLGDGGSHGKGFWLAGAATQHPMCVLHTGKAVRLLKHPACKFFTPVYELSTGGSAGQSGGKARIELRALLSQGTETCVFLLNSSWRASGSRLSSSGGLSTGAWSGCRQFPAALSLLLAGMRPWG